MTVADTAEHLGVPTATLAAAELNNRIPDEWDAGRITRHAALLDTDPERLARRGR